MIHELFLVYLQSGLDILALVVGDVNFILVTFPCCILGQVWYLIYHFLIFASFLTLITVIKYDYAIIDI